MNAIKNYLDNMFRNLPNIPEVRKAKAELQSMMEDKFEELIADGKSENEAVGIVISEFGNLDEIAETIGLSLEIKDAAGPAKPMLSMDRVKEYLAAVSSRSIMIPMAVSLCILCVTIGILSEIIGGRVGDAFSAAGFFLMIAAAVALFITSHSKNKEFAEINNGEVSLSVEAAEYVRNEKNSYRPTYGMTVGIGIALCIACIIFPIIISVIPFINDDFGAFSFFMSVAVGVFLIVHSNVRINGYERLLKLNGADNMGAEFVPAQDRKVAKWPIVLGIVAVVLVLGVAAAIGTARLIVGLSFGGKNITNHYDLGTEDVSEINRIFVEADACEVILVSDSSVDGIDVTYEGHENLMPEVVYEDDELVITQHPGRSNYNGNNSPVLTIRAGGSVAIDDVDLNMDAGRIEIVGVNAADITGEFDAADVTIRDINGTNLSVAADAGNIEISRCGFTDVDVETSAGNIEIDDTDFENLDVRSDIGSIDVTGIRDFDYYSFDVEMDIGSVNIDGSSEGSSYSSQGTGTGTITAECDAGQISFR